MPEIDPSEKMSDALVLCATHRLARRLSLAGEGAIRRLRPALTVGQWLDARTEAALLGGEMAAPPRRLSRLQERLLWRRVIDEALAGDAIAALLDRDGLVEAAIEANALIETWGVAAGGGHNEDARQFLAWRQAFRRRCDAGGWRDAARYQGWQIGSVVAGAGLPKAVMFAGFDRFNPQEQRLLDALSGAGVAVRVEQPDPATPASHCLAFDSPDRELAAAIAWAQGVFVAQPAARVGIVVPELAKRRATLLRVLDETFAPATMRAAAADAPRPYNLSLGESLNEAPGIATALELLRLALPGARPTQQELRTVLDSPWWGGGVAERLGRGQLDADLREHLPPEVDGATLLRRTWRLHYRDGGLERTARSLADLAAESARWRGRQPPSAWATAFAAALDAAGWPGERAASSREFQAQEAFAETLNALAALDEFAGRVGAGEAVTLLAEHCREMIFQPRTEGAPRLQVLGLLEAATESFDALWVCGMSDAVWPPPARPNPFLHPAAQRAAGSPNASSEVQFRFATAIHARLLRAAPAVRFSWAIQDEARVQLPSALLGADPAAALAAAAETAGASELAARLRAQAGDAAIEQVADRYGPPVAAGETVRGGTHLIRTQAACPAWGYYQYRVGARALKTPVEGLDSAGRGTIVHAVFEAFWRDRDSAGVFGWDEAVLAMRIGEAVTAGIAAFEDERGEPLPPRFRALETTRLAALLAEWLAVERQRGVPFVVAGCEVERQLSLRGLPIRVVADRVDRLADGRLVIIDYKTGRAPALSAWATQRIVEPQLPIYAAGESGEPVAAVAFADLRARPPKFAGLAAENGLLPGVGDVDGARRHFDADSFPDWQAVLATWQARLLMLADEVHAGDAAVRVDNPKTLAYAEVLPLLRLAERDWLFGAAGADGGDDA
ncbi:MAG TPA: PD-(D/E)XK nuclease family protein [Rhodocyclaceae bacterium]